METHDKSLERDLILKEYDQVWQHFRYDAELRIKYLNFFFVALSGMSAIIVALSKFVGDSVSYLVWIGFLLFASFYTTFIYVTIVKHSLGTVYYDRVLKEIRRKFIDKDVVKMITIDYIKPKKIKSYYSSTLSLTKLLLLIFLGIIHFVMICVFINNTDNNNIGYFLLAALVYLLVSVMEIIVIKKAPKVRYYRYPKEYIDPADSILPYNNYKNDTTTETCDISESQ